MLMKAAKQDLEEPSTFTNEERPAIPEHWPGKPVDYYQQSYDNNYLGMSF